jgi:hypothetical protein
MIPLHCGYGKHFLQFALGGQCMNDNTANRNHVARNKTILEKGGGELDCSRCHSGGFCPCSLPVRALSISTTFKGTLLGVIWSGTLTLYRPQSRGSRRRDKKSHVTEQPLEGARGVEMWGMDPIFGMWEDW